MKQNIFEITEFHTWAANTTTKVKIPLSGYITHFSNFLTMTYTMAVGLSAYEDPYAMLMKSLRLKASGARSFVDFSDGRQWKYFNKFQYPVQAATDIVAAGAGAGKLAYANWPIHLGTNPQDKFDRTIPIPAVALQDLTMEIDWGAAAAPGTDVTVTAATLKTHVHELVLESGDKPEDFWKGGIVTPRFEPVVNSVTANYSNLSYSYELPVGDTLNRTIVMPIDATANTRSDAHLTQLGVKFPRLRETPFEMSWRHHTFHLQQMEEFAARVAGVGLVDYADISGRALGLDLTNNTKGDATLNFTVDVTTPGTNLNLHLLNYLFS